MAVNNHPKSSEEIRNVLSILLGGILVALLFAGFMLYYHNPSGSYEAGNVLIAPFASSPFPFNDINLTTGRKEKFIMKGIEFSYYDPVKKQRERRSVILDNYIAFYNLVSKEKSLVTVPNEIKEKFYRPNSAILSFIAYPENAKNEIKTFLSADFVYEGDYYRVQLREHRANEEAWAYFYHPGIYREIFHLLSKS
jgi:hypothetical protein